MLRGGGQFQIFAWYFHNFESNWHGSLSPAFARMINWPSLLPGSSPLQSFHFWPPSMALDLLHSRIYDTIMIGITANWYYLSLNCHSTFEFYCWKVCLLFSSLLLVQLLVLHLPHVQLSSQLLHALLLLCEKIQKCRLTGCCRGFRDTNISVEKHWSEQLKIPNTGSQIPTTGSQIPNEASKK